MSGYPPALKSMLKAFPCCLMCFTASTVSYLYVHGLLRHSQDHVPKHTYKSTKFERALRFRDETNRRYFKPALQHNPNTQNILSLKPLDEVPPSSYR